MIEVLAQAVAQEFADRIPAASTRLVRSYAEYSIFMWDKTCLQNDSHWEVRITFPCNNANVIWVDMTYDYNGGRCFRNHDLANWDVDAAIRLTQHMIDGKPMPRDKSWALSWLEKP